MIVKKHYMRIYVEQSLVQILVIVENTLMKCKRAEVENGSMGTAIGHG